MKDVEIVQTFQAQNDLDEGFPDEFLVEVFLELLLVENFLVKVSIVRKLHHYA